MEATRLTFAPRNLAFALTLMPLAGCLLPLPFMHRDRAAAPDHADDYPAEPAAADPPEVPGCGEIKYTLRAAQLGPAQWGTYGFQVRGDLYQTGCDKIPRKGKLDPGFADAMDRVRTDYELGTDVVVAWDGKYWTEVDKEDLHTYRYADVVVYSPRFKLPSKCGGTDLMLACEASSSTATDYNRMVFFLQRADARRAEGKPDLCKRALENAIGNYRSARDFHDSATKDGRWISGLTYRVRGGEKLTEPQILAAIEQLGAKAQDETSKGYCGG
jgi:hypothetical protein